MLKKIIGLHHAVQLVMLHFQIIQLVQLVSIVSSHSWIFLFLFLTLGVSHKMEARNQKQFYNYTNAIQNVVALAGKFAKLDHLVTVWSPGPFTTRINMVCAK